MVNEIISELEGNSAIKIVSFDIFDTLLFRTVIKPEDVFTRMFKLYSDKFPDFTNEEDWKNARINAETKARKNKLKLCNTNEVYLSEIYKELPTVYKNIDELIQIEIECEKMSCFINEDIYETIKYIKNKLGLKVVLISDMYLGEKIISEILIENGMDCTILDGIFVSSDYGTSKSKGNLYEIVLDKFNIKNDEMYHIGDNHKADIGIPKHLGIHTYLYNLISEAQFRHPYLKMEEMAYGPIAQEIYALRLIAASKNKEEDEQNKFFFNVGAMIVGPFFTYATEWVLDLAEKEDRRIIRPLMREGKFLTELLNIAVKERKTDISIEPLYVSRFSEYTATLENITEYEIDALITPYYLSLYKIFEILNIQDLAEKYSDFYESRKLKTVQYKETNLYEDVYKFLTSEEIINEIRKRNKGSTKKLLDYLKQMRLTEKSITFDIGWRGSMQSIIHNLLKNDNINADILHLLCFAGFKAVNNAVDGCDIRGFLGNFGKNREEIAMIEQRLPEMFLMCTEGTTVGYEKKDNVVYPITQIIDYPKWQVEAIGKLQDGIKAFQKEYFKLIKLKPQIKEWCGYREELCKIFARLLSNPLLYEANFLGRIIFDQNNGVNELEPILNNDLLNKYKQEGMKNFYSKFASNNLEWYSGLNVCANPSVYYEMQLQRHRAYDLFSLILMTEQAIELAGNGKFILVGAGEHTRFILNFLVAVDKLSMVERIIDNNKNLHGVCLAGIEISEVEKVYESNIYLCTSLNKVIRDSFFLQISKILGENCNFISYFN